MRTTAAGVALAALVLAPSPGSAGELERLLEGVREQVTLLTPLRAEIGAEIEGIDGKREDRLVMIVRNSPGGGGRVQTYLEFERAKAKFLVLGPGEAHAFAGGKTKKVAHDTAVDGTTWTVEDLLPFTPDRCLVLRIVDSARDWATISCEPKKEAGSQYTIIVYKIDREKSVPVQTLYYKETLSNLVKILRATDFEAVGAKWRPTRLVMQDFKLRTKDVFALDWQQDPKLQPEIFDPKSLGDVSLSGAAK